VALGAKAVACTMNPPVKSRRSELTNGHLRYSRLPPVLLPFQTLTER